MEVMKVNTSSHVASTVLCKINKSSAANRINYKDGNNTGRTESKFVDAWFNWLRSDTGSNNSTDLSSREKELKAITERIFSHLDGLSLAAAELVCKQWYNIIDNWMLWKNLIERKVKTNSTWRELAEKEGWIQYLFDLSPGITHPENFFYRNLFLKVSRNINNMNNIWLERIYKVRRINNCNRINKGVFCMQYDDEKIIAGCRDGKIKIWNRNTLKCITVLKGHTAAVFCLQFDEKVIISGSFDCTVRVWDINSGELINTIIHHKASVLSLKFLNNVLVTGSKDHTFAVWDMKSPTEMKLRQPTRGHHKWSINAVDFDEKYITSGSGDWEIKVWNTSNIELVRTLKGHTRGVACLQYRYPLIVSGSFDKDIRIWNVETGKCLRVLKGHEDTVRCIRFNSKCIVSGDYKGQIKIWDLEGALVIERNAESLCLRTFEEHSNKYYSTNKHVYRIQFDDFQIVSASGDDTIIIRDFRR